MSRSVSKGNDSTATTPGTWSMRSRTASASSRRSRPRTFREDLRKLDQGGPKGESRGGRQAARGDSGEDPQAEQAARGSSSPPSGRSWQATKERHSGSGDRARRSGTRPRGNEFQVRVDLMDCKRILVVEDDAAIRRGLIDALSFAGYATREASEGAAGLAAALESDCDLLVARPGLAGRGRPGDPRASFARCDGRCR